MSASGCINFLSFKFCKKALLSNTSLPTLSIEETTLGELATDLAALLYAHFPAVVIGFFNSPTPSNKGIADIAANSNAFPAVSYPPPGFFELAQSSPFLPA